MLHFPVESLCRELDTLFKSFSNAKYHLIEMIFFATIAILYLFIRPHWYLIALNNPSTTLSPRRQVHFGSLYVYQLPPPQAINPEPIPVSVMDLPSDDAPSPKFGGRRIVRKTRKRSSLKKRRSASMLEKSSFFPLFQSIM